jgi:hypothetical protein
MLPLIGQSSAGELNDFTAVCLPPTATRTIPTKVQARPSKNATAATTTTTVAHNKSVHPDRESLLATNELTVLIV